MVFPARGLHSKHRDVTTWQEEGARSRLSYTCAICTQGLNKRIGARFGELRWELLLVANLAVRLPAAMMNIRINFCTTMYTRSKVDVEYLGKTFAL